MDNKNEWKKVSGGALRDQATIAIIERHVVCNISQRMSKND